MTGTKSNLLDSSVWLAYIIKNKNIELMESDEIFLLSSLSLFEIKKKFLKDKIKSDEIAKAIELIKQKSLIIYISNEIAERAAEISVENNLGMADSLIYATALDQNATLITLDNDFRGLDNINFLDGGD
ncbi:PIN domain-containing protein [Candidatus Pacearchaeota archaeon]|nr:PIN domain-containing protein [Candidatus Pacearchaeota archaeon]